MPTAPMFHHLWIKSPSIVGFLALTSCQLVTGLDALELSESGAGGTASGSGGTDSGTGGTAACLVDWESHPCHESCGDPGDGIRVGCGNFLDCYLDYDCLPATCSQSIDDQCGINAIENGTSASLAMAEGVVECLCGP